MPSSSLLPDDPSVLFTTAGMQSMVPYLLGLDHPLGTRVANSQKCFRAQDIEEVGDSRHTTSFEMLGNWSFGDYFKKEQLSWVFEFLTKELKLDPKRLYVTVFEGNEQIPRDNESVELWKELFDSVGIEAREVENAETKGMQDGRIFYYGVGKNWWSLSGTPDQMPVGAPGGPDSEMFYEFPDIQHDVKFGDKCHVNCDCGRHIEVGNNVFMEYQKQEDGSFKLLAQKNIDFGGGLERLAMAYEDKSDVFSTDVFKSIIKKVEELSGRVTYKDNPDTKKFFRVVADHTKAATMLIADGAIPSNKSQGYLVRRLIRRAVRYGRSLLDINQPFLAKVAEAVIEMYKDQYPDLGTKKKIIFEQLTQEEERFNKTLSSGLREISKHEVLDAKIAFDLYQTYGFPFELTEEIAREKGQKVEYGEFRKEFEVHQEKSRAGLEKKFGGHGLILDTGELKAANEEELKIVTRLHTATHMLHAALRKVLGNEVHQAGSDITAERLRFDFTFPRKLIPGEIEQVENFVNEAIKKDLTVTKQEMPYEEAVKTGALSFFKFKYPPKVNVYSVGDFSKELCGGPHVTHSGEIGHFKIVKEEASSAGVRRIRAIVE